MIEKVSLIVSVIVAIEKYRDHLCEKFSWYDRLRKYHRDVSMPWQATIR